MLDESHFDIAGQEGELDRAQFVKGPAFAAAASSDGFAPDRGHPFAQRLVLDPLQAGKELRDLSDAIADSLGCCRSGHIDSDLFGNVSGRRPIIAMLDRINSTHRFLARLLFDDMRHESGRSRDHENTVESRGVHS